jgi:hypothetical protein
VRHGKHFLSRVANPSEGAPRIFLRPQSPKSSALARLIGVAGASVIGRVMGMLLAALSVSVILGAVGEWLNLPKLNLHCCADRHRQVVT